MRSVLHSDLIAAARLLRSRPSEMRSWVLARLIAESTLADAWLRRTGALHPIWGDGSLATAAFRRGVPAQFALRDREYCLCLAKVCEALANLQHSSDTLEL